jgi:hypothetical protein
MRSSCLLVAIATAAVVIAVSQVRPVPADGAAGLG